jgi:hypothetical protein
MLLKHDLQLQKCILSPMQTMIQTKFNYVLISILYYLKFINQIIKMWHIFDSWLSIFTTMHWGYPTEFYQMNQQTLTYNIYQLFYFHILDTHRHQVVLIHSNAIIILWIKSKNVRKCNSRYHDSIKSFSKYYFSL